MNVIRAILYELQPFRLDDVKYMLVWARDTSLVLYAEFNTMWRVIWTTELPDTRYLMILFLWLLVYALSVWFKVGRICIIISIFCIIYFNLGDRNPGEASAYSVFNAGCRRLLGTITAEQFEREIRHETDLGEAQENIHALYPQEEVVDERQLGEQRQSEGKKFRKKGKRHQNNNRK
mmetsp:Transcript_6266/g.9462  ORF Transcript_6266/g.9462 Transcript_6266/m.9462 type:complete len:177 (+) Transcript_6266:24-554(+)